jgi:hypothetical protein
MGIPSISGVGRVTAATADASAPANAVRQGSSAPADATDDALHAPVPPRFPWLSRLSQQLESAAKQRSPFEPAPLLGDHLDKSA